MDRRTFLTSVIGSAGAVALVPQALAEDAVFHVLYPGSTTPAQASELLEQVAGALGSGVAARLRVVEHEGAHVVLFDRSGLAAAADRVAAAAVASRHDALLREAYDEQRTFAVVVSSGVVDATWNVRYGQPGPEEAQQRVWATVSRLLGTGVAKALVVETISDGTHQVIYRRRGDRTGTSQVAAHHARLLRSVGLEAVAVPDSFGTLTFDATTASEATLDLPDVNALIADEAEAEPPPSVEAEVAEASAKEDTGIAEPSEGVATPGPHPPPACYDGLPSLQAQINAHIQDLRASGRVTGVERTAWLVHDLVADRTICAINADLPLQAASMIKPFVALAFFHQVSKGKLAYGEQSLVHMERMIRDSNNSSTNWVMERVGGPAACHAILHKHYGAIVDQLDLVEYIPSSGCTYRNRASARDHARLLQAVWRDQVPSARELRRVLNLPGPDRLYCAVPQIPAGTEVYNKTGTTAMCCGDMGILVARTQHGHRVPYVIVGVIERSNRTSQYTSWSHARADVIRGVSGLTYGYLREVYDLA